MTERLLINKKVAERVARVYNWLSLQTPHYSDPETGCKACGQCCDFDSFDHRLFVTPPELIYLIARLGPENIKPMPTTRCPYNNAGQCGIYQHRFAGCRIFCCKADADFQSRLSESALKKIKLICTELEIPYRYTDLATALNNFVV